MMDFSNISITIKYDIFLYFLKHKNENNVGMEYLLYTINLLSNEKIDKKVVENILNECQRISNGDIKDCDEELCYIVNNYIKGKHITNLDDAKAFYFENGCNDMAICKDGGTLGIEFLNFKIDDEIFFNWNNEYFFKKSNEEISDYLLDRFIHKNVSKDVIIRIYDIFIERLNNKTWNNKKTKDFLLTQEIMVLDDPFSGLISKIALLNDKQKLDKLINIYIEALKENIDLKGCLSLALFSLYYDLKLDDYIIKISNNKAEEWFNNACQDGDELWPICCYLMGIKKEKSIINAYRVVRFGYDKYGKKSDCLDNLLSFLNKVTKNNYTLDYVLNLKPLVSNFKESDFDKFIKNEIKKINSYN